MSDTIQSIIQQGVAKITLNRPEKFNSFNREMALELQKQLDNAEENPEVRAILLTGNGKAFCAGQDLKEAIDDNDIDIQQIVAEHYNPIIKRLREIEKPIIAAINGVAAGAGANIAFACDITLAKKSANFIQAFSKIGLIPDSGGTFYLPRIIGMQKAAALTFTGNNLSAEEAEKMNLIYKTIEDDKFEEESWAFAAKLASMPTKGIGLTKRLLNATWNNSLQQQLEMEKEMQYAATNTYDYKEGVNAFLEKRKPEFKGE